MAVSKQERQLAKLMDLDTARVVRKAIDDARRIGFRLQQSALRAFKNGQDVAAAALTQLDAAVPLLADAMTLAHLTGLQRAIDLAPQTLRLDREALASSLRNLMEKLGLNDDALRTTREFHTEQAATIISTTGTALSNGLQEAFLEINAEGLSLREGVKVLRQTFAAQGLTPDNSFTLEALFRTETQLAYSAGQFTADQDPAIQDILWGYRYVTVGDERVRPEHVGLDGMTLAKDDGLWNELFPPNGWACRCKAIPIFEQRETVRPPDRLIVDGREVRPGADVGFRFHPGKLGQNGAAVPLIPAVETTAVGVT